MPGRTSLTEKFLRSLIVILARSITKIIFQVYLTELRNIDRGAGYPFFNRRAKVTEEEESSDSGVEIEHPPQRPGRDEVDNRN